MHIPWPLFTWYFGLSVRPDFKYHKHAAKLTKREYPGLNFNKWSVFRQKVVMIKTIYDMWCINDLKHRHFCHRLLYIHTKRSCRFHYCLSQCMWNYGRKCRENQSIHSPFYSKRVGDQSIQFSLKPISFLIYWIIGSYFLSLNRTIKCTISALRNLEKPFKPI